MGMLKEDLLEVKRSIYNLVRQYIFGVWRIIVIGSSNPEVYPTEIGMFGIYEMPTGIYLEKLSKKLTSYYYTERFSGNRMYVYGLNKHDVSSYIERESIYTLSKLIKQEDSSLKLEKLFLGRMVFRFQHDNIWKLSSIHFTYKSKKHVIQLTGKRITPL